MYQTAERKQIHVLVTGATGSIGPCVVQALLQAGCTIRTLSLDAPAVDLFPKGIDVLTGDVTDRTSVLSAMEGIDAVIHLAALLHIVNPPPDMRDRYDLVNIGGTSTVVEAAMKAGVKRIVLFSTIAVYGQANGSVLDEQSPTRPETFYARTKLASEKIVLNARGADGNPLGTVLRLGAVYGSRIKGNYERLTRSLAHYRFIPVGSCFHRRTLIYDKDVGRAAALTVLHPTAAGRVFNVTDGEFHSMRTIIESICSALGRRPPWFSLPLGPTRTLIRVIEKGSRAIGFIPPVTSEMIEKYVEDIAVDGRLIQRELGFTPQYDLKTGWEETIREMQA